MHDLRGFFFGLTKQESKAPTPTILSAIQAAACMRPSVRISCATKRPSIALLVALVFANSSCFSAQYQPSVQEVLAALEKRSGIPETELQLLLGKCDASQSAMNICAYRDVVAADLVLQHTVARKIEQSPGCKASLEASTARWASDRARGCKQGAAKDYGSGSLAPMAESMCMTHELEQMTKRIERQRSCAR
ncbi:lysozyme inhibitor LprI family protein [Variovorax sp. OV329]|uniref:lysozyme inhibitor LprI family protein n=1 Tax=Variovorax sp. OV329 TaxID=1882825 RepID=UPI0020C8E114|nr:lysozyme inhibitor LprI family protein [Variovorax sp. OV329]